VDEYLVAIARGQRRVVHALTARLGSLAEAEDVVQSALLRALDRAGDLRDRSKVVSWFRRILKAALADHERRRAAYSRARSRIGGALQFGGPGDIELYWETCQCLEVALEAVRPVDARLLRQIELEGRSLRDVARVLGIRTNTAAVRLHRARRAVVRVWRDICQFCRLHWRLDCACKQHRGAGRTSASSSV
jgi:RNA polymerase sigma-70 factor (ECF subfamily)